MDLSQTIIPKSDQLNADDLITGPRIIKITGITGGSAEQPVVVNYEGDNGRPYKPSKSMRRILVALYGNDSAACIGKRLKLYRDAEIKFGGDAVGGIRISHADGISRPLVMALTLKRGQRAQYRVEPLPAEQPHEPRDLATLESIAETKIKEGAASLTQWATTLPAAEKKLIGAERFASWKARAA
jgi:hypothetical protein